MYVHRFYIHKFTLQGIVSIIELSFLASIEVRFHFFASNEFTIRSIDLKVVFGVRKHYHTVIVFTLINHRFRVLA